MVPQNGVVYNGKPYQNGWFGGTPIFGNTHIFSATSQCHSSNWKVQKAHILSHAIRREQIFSSMEVASSLTWSSTGQVEPKLQHVVTTTNDNENHHLVGGFNPFKKNVSQIGSFSPRNRGKNKTCLRNHQLVIHFPTLATLCWRTHWWTSEAKSDLTVMDTVWHHVWRHGQVTQRHRNVT